MLDETSNQIRLFDISSTICHFACDTCLAATYPANTCLTCESGFTKQTDGSCTCNPGTVLLGLSCVPCDSSCQLCSGISTSCSSCFSGFYLEGLQCKPCATDPTKCPSTPVAVVTDPIRIEYKIFDKVKKEI